MDFRDTPEEAAFRAEVAGWLDGALADVPADQGTGSVQWSRVWQERLSEGGWVGIDWPQRYGGRGLGAVHQAIFTEEAARRGAPHPLNGQGMMLAGPTILAHGSEAQRERFLGPILRSEQYWCQGFSEPGAGSDLAGLQTRARRVDGGWVISGEKVWTSWAHTADRCMLLARTDRDAPKHEGITYFLADMRGVEVRPLVMINGDAEFNQVFVDELFVPDEDVLGPVGGGWRVALTTLAFERAGLALTLWVWARRAVDALVAAARGREDPEITAAVGRLHARAEAVRIGSIRMFSEIAAGGEPGPEGSALKLSWAGVIQEASRMALELDGGGGPALDRYLRARGHSIEGGSDEVQKSILAERVLALPRSR